MKKIVLDKESNFVFCFLDSNIIIEKRGKLKEDISYKKISNVGLLNGERQVVFSLLLNFLAFIMCFELALLKMFRKKSILKIDLFLGKSIEYRIDNNINTDTIQEVLDCFQSRT